MYRGRENCETAVQTVPWRIVGCMNRLPVSLIKGVIFPPCSDRCLPVDVGNVLTSHYFVCMCFVYLLFGLRGIGRLTACSVFGQPIFCVFVQSFPCYLRIEEVRKVISCSVSYHPMFCISVQSLFIICALRN